MERPLNAAGGLGSTSTPATRTAAVARTTRDAMAMRTTRNMNVDPRKLSKTAIFKKYVVPIIATVLVIAALVVIGVLIKVVLDNYYFFCQKSFKFISIEKWCNGVSDCSEDEDEKRCVESILPNALPEVRISQTRSLLQVNIQKSGTWGLVCYDSFDRRKALAVCSTLGFNSEPSFSSVPVTDSLQNLPFSMVDVTSNGGIQTSRAAGCQTVVSISCQSCGSSQKRDRIIGGAKAPIQNWPWQVSLQYQGQHICGGSIISRRWIVSAAHCFPNGQRQVDRWRIQEGMSSLSLLFATPVDRIFVHTLYPSMAPAYDIAVIKLKKDLTLSDSIQPVCLPSFDLDLPSNTKLWVTGWGNTVENSKTPTSSLQEVSIGVIPSSTCETEYPGQITDTMLCAGRLGGGYDTCQGDSGGPLVYYSNSQHWEQVGIVSFGQGCGRPGKVGVYTKVESYLDWIYGVMKLVA